MSASAHPAPPVFFRPPSDHDLSRICALEAAGYPLDEAASPSQLEFRLREAPELFLVAEGPDSSVVAYACGTACHGSSLTHESMSSHDPEGSTLALHSVCVAAKHRRQGLATRLLKAYIQYVQVTAPQISTMVLLCKDHLVALYEGAGFGLIGPSSVVHGQDVWLEMRLDFSDSADGLDWCVGA
ncbi:hypothetical protein ACKKBG_A04715 [Auxenochlorella protothecoides x Auxenochlorella symbiontica]